ncbi:MAG: signal peptide peptidase SppA [Lewinellaceae bacterium]|nr:signal peptide peptidase SppA [Saprospiraceae bacterium]MCB9315896.1 signal peptide peptidase SppA [Lewinellaceae bacterium]MCB9330575.1 signal peptide peptidase SppA [Lewinellaceae bacterium]
MSQFLKFIFASCLGTFLALVLLFFFGIWTITGFAEKAMEKEKVSLKANSVLELKFEMPIPEKTNNLPLDPFDMDRDDVLGLTDMVKAIAQAKEDPDIKGIYINAMYLTAGKATASVLRNALLDFKTSGKFIVAYANFYTQNAYYVASVADEVLINPIGAVDFRGLSGMIMFYKGMLDKLDIQMRIFYAGKFKGATEPYRLDKMSPENRLQIREYISALYDEMVSDISKSRNISQADLRAVADNFDGKSAKGAVENKLVDRIAYEDEAFDLLRSKIGLDEKEKLNRVSVESYFSSRVKKFDLSSKDKIAVLFAEGTIVDGDKADPGDICDGKYVKMLRQIRKDDNVKAIVLRINSPGGSVLASENILREVQLCQQAGKPVVVSMGDVAASGGYYIACQADSIFAEPTTITGSIGVFGIIPILQKTMKDNLGITMDTVRTGKYSAFGTPFYDFSPEESAMIQSRVEWIYQDFLEKVAKGRNMTPEAVHEIAQGRVWAGEKAKSVGLVDDMGGLDRALSAAAKLAGLEKYRTTEFPRTKTGLEQLLEKFDKSKDSDEVIRAWMLRSELGEMYPVYKTLQDMRKNQGIQARLPFELVIN